MKTAPIEPAEVDFGDPLAPAAPRFGDVYHARQGAFEQARHVFLGGNGLPDRWRDRTAFTILETGFGLGNNFLATWQAWQAWQAGRARPDPHLSHDSPAARSPALRFLSIEKHPLRIADLARAHAASPAPALARALVDAWPPLTPGMHVLSFGDGRVELLLFFGDVASGLREIVAGVDAFYLDGFSPARNREMWDERVWRALSRLAAPGATAATWSAAAVVRDGLARAGFEVHKAPGRGGKRDITLARHAPRVAPHRPAFRVGSPRTREIAIVGAGVAGAMAARALAREGVRVHVFEAADTPAAGASGNPAALVHGTYHPGDGPHARVLRAAALQARDVYAEGLAAGVPGRLDGLLRVVDATHDDGDGTRPADADEQARADADADADADAGVEAGMEADAAHAGPDADAALAGAIAGSGLPPDFVHAWSAARVQAIGGPRLPAACYPGGGWISPADAVRWALGEDGVVFHPATRVHALRARAGDGAPRWTLLGTDGRVLLETDGVVLAGGIEAASFLADRTTVDAPVDRRPFESVGSVRGQLSTLAPGTPGLRLPGLPISGGGYVIPLPDGRAVVGATSQPEDRDPAVRAADHVHNLAKLTALTASDIGADVRALEASGRLSGRVGWRATTPDRLPWIGAVPASWPPAAAAADADPATKDAAATPRPRRRDASSPPDQPRHWPRVPGLFVASGLGSRGVTWAPLAARLLVSWILDAPFPVEASLVDALDPARACARAVRRARSEAATAP